ncbi:SNARE protein [Plasmodium brasilianum]|uniref:SNARE protein, putative n=2 Tax=Plasmodium (Plasmodium) TaxID=418103 RepID=A0A1A8VSP3_PLAMA|nr:SNARE protein, putative [Plasmodium malariae]KAI4839964.1 SNARE protein [Plasmodium brasilianum]SBS82693.1 SNARE protein, putative (VAMP7) [Plasmodium malariae]SBT87331.1 SNARE protein, putative [Plasmodium malariae]
MYMISDDEISYSNSMNSEEEIESEENSEEYSKYYEGEEEDYSSHNDVDDENEFQLFKYVCIASLDELEIIMKCSFLSRDSDISANNIIKKILIASKKKLSYCNKKILNWDNRIIYFIICSEKKLALFLIGLDMKAYFKNYAFEFLRKLEIYAKSDLFFNQNYNSNNINPSKAQTIQRFMKRTIINLNECCKDEKIIAVKQKLNKINSVMNNHIDNLYQSRGNIKALQYKTENMSKNTLNFVKNTKKLKRIMFLKYWKTYFFLACFVVIGFKVYRSI